MKATECCGWTGWAEMAGIGNDGRRVGDRTLDAPTPHQPAAEPEIAPVSELYLLLRRVGRRAGVPPHSASAERAVGAP